MIVASIRKGKDNYYINLEQNNDRFNYYVVYASNEGTYILNKNQTINLFKDLFDSKMVFKEKEKNYDVYIDESGNKRYFKNGSEDYFKLFINNGKPTTMYGEIEEKAKEAKNKFEFVRVTIKKGIFVTEFVASAFLVSTLIETIRNPETKYSENFIFGIDAIDETISGDLTVEEMSNYIRKTKDKNIDKNKKEFFSNEDLFNDVLDYSDPSRYYSLRKKMKNFNIRYFDETDEEKINDGVVGYYNPKSLNTINIANDSIDSFNYAAGHEFIHLLQDDNSYYYIREACAEIMQWEYFDEPISAYYNQVKRVYKLMEIIGPGPVMECNFKGDTSNFENVIISNLGEEDGNRLLELFTKSPCYDKEVIEDVNKEIDGLLTKMYTNVYKKNINDDILFKNYLDNENIQYGARIYFNENNELYNKPLEVYYTKETIIDGDGLNNEDYTFTCYYKEDIDGKTYDELKDKLGEIVNKNYDCIDGYEYSKIDNNFISTDGKEVYNEKEAKEKKLYTKVKYTHIRYEKYDSYKSLKENATNYVNCTVFSKTNDMRIGKLETDKNNNDKIIAISSCIETVEPVSEKFSNQLATKTNKENLGKGW